MTMFEDGEGSFGMDTGSWDDAGIQEFFGDKWNNGKSEVNGYMAKVLANEICKLHNSGSYEEYCKNTKNPLPCIKKTVMRKLQKLGFCERKKDSHGMNGLIKQLKEDGISQKATKNLKYVFNSRNNWLFSYKKGDGEVGIMVYMYPRITVKEIKRRIKKASEVETPDFKGSREVKK